MNIDGTPVITQGKTAYYVTDPDGGELHVTGADHRRYGWFSKTVARQLAREHGGMYYEGNRTTVKDVVTYLARSGAPSVGPASERPAAVARVIARGSKPSAIEEAEGDFGPGGAFA